VDGLAATTKRAREASATTDANSVKMHILHNMY
jgi:hypothetical protein